MIYTGEQLVTEIQKIAGIPAREIQGYKKADLLEHADAFLSSRLLAQVMAGREDFYVQRERIAITSTKNDYRIPTRAIGDKLRGIWYVDTQGNRCKLDPILVSELHRYSPTSTTLHGFYFTATMINLVGNPGSGFLELSYGFRVGKIVLSTEARQVVTVPTANQLTIGSSLAGFVANAYTDIHSAYGGHDLKLWRNKIASVAGGGLTINLTDPIDGSTFGTRAVEVGDWICLERQTALVALPEELIPALARGVAKRISEAENDREGAEYHSAEGEKDAKAATSLVASDRVQAKPARFMGRSSPFFGGSIGNF